MADEKDANSGVAASEPNDPHAGAPAWPTDELARAGEPAAVATPEAPAAPANPSRPQSWLKGPLLDSVSYELRDLEPSSEPPRLTTKPRSGADAPRPGVADALPPGEPLQAASDTRHKLVVPEPPARRVNVGLPGLTQTAPPSPLQPSNVQPFVQAPVAKPTPALAEATSDASAEPARSPTGDQIALTMPLVGWVISVAAVLAIAGGAGYWLGYRHAASSTVGLVDAESSHGSVNPEVLDVAPPPPGGTGRVDHANWQGIRPGQQYVVLQESLNEAEAKEIVDFARQDGAFELTYIPHNSSRGVQYRVVLLPGWDDRAEAEQQMRDRLLSIQAFGKRYIANGGRHPFSKPYIRRF